jgi:hypothetical protein
VVLSRLGSDRRATAVDRSSDRPPLVESRASLPRSTPHYQ